jgi:molybdopterin synthase catalytic subunit
MKSASFHRFKGDEFVIREIVITHSAIDEAKLIAERNVVPGVGAVVAFTGTVRGSEAGEEISGIDYEAFEKMAFHQFNLLLDEMVKRWPVKSVRVVHRAGKVGAGEPSVWIEVMTPHRVEAFEASQWFLSEMKRVVPIWKKTYKN